MGRLSNGLEIDPKGNALWDLDQVGSTPDGDCLGLRCTYLFSETEVQIIDFYLNGFLIEQEDIRTECFDLYDTDNTKNDIIDALYTEAAHKTFIKEHGGMC